MFGSHGLVDWELCIKHQNIRLGMETVKDLIDEAKRRTILVALLVLIVAYVMSCMSIPHLNPGYT